jgi:hypothetical protein
MMPLYRRFSRTYLTRPMAEPELQPPQGKQARPASSLVAVLLPLGFTLLGLGLTVASATDGYGRSTATSVLASGSWDNTVRLWGVK